VTAGRKKQYQSAAERQAAYRARKAAENVTDDVLRNCPSCGGELMDLTDRDPTFDFVSLIKVHDGRAYICSKCWKCTTQIPPNPPVVGELRISARVRPF
jgi:hypothetical protein